MKIIVFKSDAYNTLIIKNFRNYLLIKGELSEFFGRRINSKVIR